MLAKVTTSVRPIRHMKTLFRGGVNPASGSLAAGTRVRIVHSPATGTRRVNG
jgi:hypothetical protein